LLAAGAGTIAAVFGLSKPRSAKAAVWPHDAYGAATMTEALRNLYGTGETIASTAVKVRAPARVQSGDVVPVSVSTDLADVRAISILIDKNTPPLAAHVTLSGGAAFFAVNLRMASTSHVHAVVEAGGKLYTTKQSVYVAAGA
jgi:sulfur-oxidizing protein SoxY